MGEYGLGLLNHVGVGEFELRFGGDRDVWVAKLQKARDFLNLGIYTTGIIRRLRRAIEIILFLRIEFPFVFLLAALGSVSESTPVESDGNYRFLFETS